MATSRLRADLAQDAQFQQRLLIIAAKLAHEVMNTVSETTKEGKPNPTSMKLRAKATEFINNPESFDKKLAISVAAVLTDDCLDDVHRSDTGLYVPDADLEEVMKDVFDGMAGVYGGYDANKT